MAKRHLAEDFAKMAALLEMSCRFSGLTLCKSAISHISRRTIQTQGWPLLFQATAVLQAEPMKKKKRVDSQALISKEQKKKRKIEKTIKKLEFKGRILKPVEEISGFRNVLKTLDQRKRGATQLTFEESERRVDLHKEWARYKAQQHANQTRDLKVAMEAADRALQELRAESEELYIKAIAIDENLVPFYTRGPTSTPPIAGYLAPDGEVQNTTKRFEGETPEEIDLIR